ncbi:MAG: rod-binding protein [Planctomycetes bacterium]|nr:rod-binding protein [Planctomycetota bacterium]
MPVAAVLRREGVGRGYGPGDERKVAAAAVGIFLEQLLSAMQSTVPEDGLGTGGRGEQMFRGQMNQVLAEDLSGRLDLGTWFLKGLHGDFKKVQETVDPSSRDHGREGASGGRLEILG